MSEKTKFWVLLALLALSVGLLFYLNHGANHITLTR
jgi:hypothetical protein